MVGVVNDVTEDLVASREASGDLLSVAPGGLRPAFLAWRDADDAGGAGRGCFDAVRREITAMDSN